MNIRENKAFEFNNDVIKLGNNLFLHQEKGGQYQFDYLTGRKSIEQDQIKNFRENIQNNNKIAKLYNTPYIHLVMPAKPCAFKEQFKEIGLEINSIFGENHKLDNVYYPSLTTDDYYSGDTHVNHHGIVKILKYAMEKFNLPKLPKATYETNRVAGDLDFMYGRPPENRLFFKKFINETTVETTEVFTLDPYIEGNLGHIDYLINPLAINMARIIVFGDSFLKSARILLSHIFSEVIYFRSPYIIEDFVKNLSPDFIITENAERYLVDVPSSSIPVPYFISYIQRGFKKKISPRVSYAFTCLFSGRYSVKFERFYSDFNFGFKDKVPKPESIVLDDILSQYEISFIRDLAISLEDSDPRLALKLMEMAYQKRNGGYILQKIEEYRNKLINAEHSNLTVKLI